MGGALILGGGDLFRERNSAKMISTSKRPGLSTITACLLFVKCYFPGVAIDFRDKPSQGPHATTPQRDRRKGDRAIALTINCTGHNIAVLAFGGLQNRVSSGKPGHMFALSTLQIYKVLHT